MINETNTNMKHTLRILAATILASAVISACEEDPFRIDPATLEDPTEDAVLVKADKSFIVFGDPSDDMAAALGRRLQKGTGSLEDADCYIFDLDNISAFPVDMDQWARMISRVHAGEAALLVTQCTYSEFSNFTVLYNRALAHLHSTIYQDNPETQQSAVASAESHFNSVMYNAFVASLGAGDGIETKATTVNDMPVNPDGTNDIPLGAQSSIMVDAWGVCGNHELYIINESFLKKMDPDAYVDEADDEYEWGQKADAVADWLDHQGMDDERTRAGLAAFRSAVTKAGDISISDLMDAQTVDFVFPYLYPNMGCPGTDSRAASIKVQYIAYSAYDFKGDTEYYQVRQNITVMNENIFHGFLPENAWAARNNDDEGYDLSRGAWMKRIDTKMSLVGAGTKSIVSVAPLNENGTSSGSSSTGKTETTTSGFSAGFSWGISATWSFATGLSLGGNLSQSNTWSWSDSNGTTWNTATNWSVKDLTTQLTEGSDASVSWTHTGNTPSLETDEGTWPSNVKSLLKSTCVTDENVLWKVSNPSGSYQLRADFNVVSEILTLKADSSQKDWTKLKKKCVQQNNKNTITFDLWRPDRFKAKWNNVIYDYGSVQGDITLTTALDNYIMSNYGYGSACFCWAGLFTSSEQTADGSEKALAVFTTFKNSIRGAKQQLKAKGFGGQLVFGLKRDGVDENGEPYDLIDQLTLDLD